MFPQEIIRKKRDGGALGDGEIELMVRGLSDGTLGDGQAAAFAMAVYFRGMAFQETAALTRAMARSGLMLRWSLPGPVLDKHSTGGVGDKVSLMLAPLVAACGGFVPMISGRSLGHTGGTLDKLDSIPGYASTPDVDRFRRVVAETGCAIIGQTADLAPADRRLYAIRDVTATVESIPLITASILAKKLAAGVQGLAMDVKFGSGAFMPELESARALAHSIVGVARAAGLPTTALLTDMHQPLGRTAGNALEVREAIEWLTGARGNARLGSVVLALGAEMLCLGRLATSEADARRRLVAARDSGAAAERFQRMVAALGGPADLLEKATRHLPPAPAIHPVPAPRGGIVQSVDVRAVGLVVMALGGGRRRAEDRIDPRVGLSDLRGVGEVTGPDRPLAFVHAADDAAAEVAARALAAAYAIGDVPATSGSVIAQRLDSLDATVGPDWP